MPEVEVRIATPDDRPALRAFYRTAYRDDHPVHADDWWTWQFGDPAHGRVVVATVGATVVGHIGVCLAAGRGWTTLLFLAPEHRGRGLGIVREMYRVAGGVAPLGATNSNERSAELHRRHGWHELDRLRRFVLVRPGTSAGRPWDPVDVGADRFGAPPDAHYFRQPGLRGVGLAGGAGVLQPEVGGLRVVRLGDPGALAEEAWAAGLGWADYVTSTNDPWCDALPELGWTTDREAGVPWRLDPLVEGSVAAITYFQADPVQLDLVVTREMSDHGRVGSRVLHR